MGWGGWRYLGQVGGLLGLLVTGQVLFHGAWQLPPDFLGFSNL